MADNMALPHTLSLHSRSKLTMTGVSEIVSFDDNTVILHTAQGTLVVLGRELQLKALTPDGGNVTITGQVSALQYEEKRAAGDWLRRLLG